MIILKKKRCDLEGCKTLSTRIRHTWAFETGTLWVAGLKFIGLKTAVHRSNRTVYKSVFNLLTPYMPLIPNNSESDRMHRKKTRTVYANFIIEQTAVNKNQLLKTHDPQFTGYKSETGAVFTTQADIYGLLHMRAPDPPLNVIAVADTGRVNVSWTTPLTNGGLEITSYIVTYNPGAISIDTALDTSITISGLTNGLAYTFTVYAVNKAGSSLGSIVSESVIPCIQAIAGKIATATPEVGYNGGVTIRATEYFGNIQWQSSIDNSVFVDISGANVALYTTMQLTRSMYYRTALSYPPSLVHTSGSIYIIVNAQSIAGTINGADINAGYDTSKSLVLTDSFGAIQWQSSLSDISSEYIDISGEHYVTYSTGKLTATTFYKAIVKNLASAPATASITVTVDAASVAGTVTCSVPHIGYNMHTVLDISDDCIGTIFQWQSSYVSASGFVDISGATTRSYTTANLTANTYYQAIVTNGASASATTTPATMITVDAQSTAGTIEQGANVNAGYGTVIGLDLSGNTGTIQWQSSTVADSGFIDISGNGTTSTSYISGALTTNTYYRVMVTNMASASVASDVTMVTVNPASETGTVSTVASEIGINKKATLKVTDYVGTIVWQSSTNGTSYIDIINATLPDYISDALTVSTYYRVVARNLYSPSSTSSAIFIVVDGLSTAGSVSASATTIGYSGSTILSLGSSIGSIQWQYSQDGSSYSNIVDATGVSYTANNLTVDTYYKAKVTNLMSDPVYSDPITIAVSTI